jgi:chemotaxis methyl-accepting protein methylase
VGSLKFEIVAENTCRYRERRIQQGEVYAGPEPAGTLLRSCVCVGFYHPGKKIGALSHITGFREEEGHQPAGALRLMRQALAGYGLDPGDCECFMIGGSSRQRQVYENTVRELRRLKIPFEELDILGRSHRKLHLEPAAGRIMVYKKPDGEGQNTFRADEAGQCFNDPKRRVVTGASTFFRNKHLLDILTREVLPSACPENNRRFHVWCAGCSIGVEVYSVAMVVLDWLEKKRRNADFLIVGSDISPDAVQTAITGEYPIGKFYRPPWDRLIPEYTEELSKHRVRMGPALRRAARFRQRDILEGSRKHRFEVIICDHVLQYFEEAMQWRFLDSMVRALQPEGFLFVSSPLRKVLNAIPARYNLTEHDRHFFRKNP